MNYEAKKRLLGIEPTALDTGMPVHLTNSVVTTNSVSDYLPGKAKDYRKFRPPPLKEDLSHLNSRDFRRRQRMGRKGGKRRAGK